MFFLVFSVFSASAIMTFSRNVKKLTVQSDQRSFTVPIKTMVPTKTTVPTQKIFGIGYPKTGTTTLGYCFERLGCRHQSYDMLLAEKFCQGDRLAVLNAAKAYDTFEDWPWFLAYETLATAYPQAKFILTMRQTSSAYVNSLYRHRQREGAFSPDFIEPSWWRTVLGHAPNFWNPDFFRAKYEAHNEAVIRYFQDKPNRLLMLCWEKGDGWNELCTFLGKPLPQEPFPHLNKGCRHACVIPNALVLPD